jgi:TRAP-type C4-dicarboxylate transport system permease small subunit
VQSYLALIKRGLISGFSVLLGINGFLMIIIATLQMVSRAFGKPVAWTVEVLLFLGLYSIIPGAAIVFLKGEEVEVSFFVDCLPKVLALWISRIMALLGAVFGAVLIYANLDYRGLVSLGKPEQYLPFPLEVNTWPLYLLGLCILWRMTEKLIATFRSSGVEKPDIRKVV